MAEKTTKKAAPAPEKTLAEQLTEKRSDLMQAKKSHAAGELINPRALTTARKDVARLLTKINAEKESK